MKILAIETSCDETSAAVVEHRRGRYVVLSSVFYSQIATHAKTGGVVPEVAAREHCVKIVPVIQEAIKRAGVSQKDIAAVAVTAGPGLLTSLIVGVEAARTLAYLWHKPLIPVNHIEGHVAANWLVNVPVRFPALCLVVSGGHTELLLMKREGEYGVLGRTLDDAAGEAFDKVGKLLGLPYPGGPSISKLAMDGDATRYDLPRSMLSAKNFDFSFAGIKTAVLYLVHGVPGKVKRVAAGSPATASTSNEGGIPPNGGDPSRSGAWKEKIKKADVAASFQQAVIDVLIGKTVRAAKEHGAKSVLLGGGVAANEELRRQLQTAVEQQLPNARYFQPALEYCTDNAAMIGARAVQLYRNKRRWPWKDVEVDPNWELWNA